MAANFNIRVFLVGNYPADEAEILSVDIDPETNTLEILIDTDAPAVKGHAAPESI